MSDVTSMNTVAALEQLKLLPLLKTLADKKSIRQLDYQFARFILSYSNSSYSNGSDSDSLVAENEALAFLAGVVSAELGRGHICLPLSDSKGQPVDLAAKVGLFGDAALALNQRLLMVDWQKVLTDSNLVGRHGEAVPMIFDGERLYLHRYWHYESMLAERLHRFGSPMILKPTEIQMLSKVLNHLFARNYRFLFTALKEAKQSGGLNAGLIQQLVCDHLDVIPSAELNWQAINALISHHTTKEQLNELDSLVPDAACVNWQKVAAAVALTRRFAVISGGPGTGKTTTVTKLLAALIEQAQTSSGTPTIKLVAPTGKAAARLTESIGKAIDQLPVSPELKNAIPTDSSTIHRLLGALPNSAEFRHNQSNPLHLDILVVDEASMVDLPMMYKLVDALPKHARLILLGDKDQLASVEAGAVLGDICSFYQHGFSAGQGNTIAQLTGYQSLAPSNMASSNRSSDIADCLCMLQKSYRFDARSGIGQLAKAINVGSVAHVATVWEKGFSDITKFAIDSQNYNQMIQTLVLEYAPYLQRMRHRELDSNTEQMETSAQQAKAALDQFNRCRLLCAVREGDFGVAGLNSRIERALAARKLIQTQDELWYHGRPVMVTRNDHGLGLYNGDIGLCMRDGDGEDARLKVFFELPDGSVKSVLPSRVPEHETAFAMTIHKSQGSEFDFTLMILPPDYSPILTRELIYTGITRAKKRLALYADDRVVNRSIKVKTERASGLIAKLMS